MQGWVTKRGKAWYFTTHWAGKDFPYRVRPAHGPSLKIRTGPAEAGLGFGKHGSAVVYQRGVVVGDFSIHSKAESLKGLGMASGFYLHLGVRGELVSWAITTSSGEVVDRGVMTGATSDSMASASSAERAATIARGARAALLDPSEYGIGGQQLYWGWLDWNGRKMRLNAGVSLNGLGAEDWDIVGGGMENAHTFVLRPGTTRSNSWSFQDATNVGPIWLHAVPREEWPRNSQNNATPILRVEPFAMQGRTQRAEIHGAFVPLNGARKLLASDRAFVVVWNGGTALARLYVTKSMADALLVWLDALEERGFAGTPDTGYEVTEKVALGGTAAEHATDFQMARQELMEAVNDAREALANGQCLVAGSRIDNGYVAYGRLQASAYEGKDISEASRLLRELKNADEPFEKKCVRTEPQSDTHERTMRMMRPGLAGLGEWSWRDVPQFIVGGKDVALYREDWAHDDGDVPTAGLRDVEHVVINPVGKNELGVLVAMEGVTLYAVISGLQTSADLVKEHLFQPFGPPTFSDVIFGQEPFYGSLSLTKEAQQAFDVWLDKLKEQGLIE